MAIYIPAWGYQISPAMDSSLYLKMGLWYNFRVYFLGGVGVRVKFLGVVRYGVMGFSGFGIRALGFSCTMRIPAHVPPTHPLYGVHLDVH